MGEHIIKKHRSEKKKSKTKMRNYVIETNKQKKMRKEKKEK